jgi:hypothetical protein
MLWLIERIVDRGTEMSCTATLAVIFTENMRFAERATYSKMRRQLDQGERVDWNTLCPRRVVEASAAYHRFVTLTIAMYA